MGICAHASFHILQCGCSYIKTQRKTHGQKKKSQLEVDIEKKFVMPGWLGGLPGCLEGCLDNGLEGLLGLPLEGLLGLPRSWLEGWRLLGGRLAV